MRKIIYQGEYLTMSTENIAGHIYERVALRPGVKILAIKNNKILFIKEYRTHEKSARWKLVSGWVDKKNKTTLEIAKEELREEASYRANNWRLFHQHNTPNQTIEQSVSYFLATDLKLLSKQKNPDSNIVEEITFLNKNEVIEKLQKKEIYWDEDMAVLLMYLENKM
jgi:ADP-ribose pyrophosphatase